MSGTKQRRTKAEREAIEKAALRQRLRDILNGAHGSYSMSDPDSEEFAGIVNEIGIEAFSRFVGAIRRSFFEKVDEQRPWQTDLAALHHFDSLDSAVDYLYKLNIKASTEATR